ESLSLDLGEVVPSVAGPRRPQDRVSLRGLRENFRAAFADGLVPASDRVSEASEESFPASDAPSHETQSRDPQGQEPTAVPTPVSAAPIELDYRPVEVEMDGNRFEIQSGSVLIAAITSCTNTSNPSVMVAAGLVAKRAV